MKIAIFSAQYLPTVGGVERYTNSLGRALINKGHEVVVVTSGCKDKETIENENTGIKVYRLPSYWFMDKRLPIIKVEKQLYKLLNKIKEEKFDFIIVQTRFYSLSLLGARLANKNNIPCIVVEHGTGYLLKTGFLGLLGRLYEHCMMHCIKLYTNEFYGVSHKCCEWLGKFQINTDKVLYNAVDLEEINRYLCISKIEKYSHQFSIVFAGRFITEKGIFELAHAFDKLQSERNIKLIMIGKGPKWEDIKKLNISNLKLMGELEHGDTLKIISQSDLFCLPTYSEGFATVVLEAAAVGTPVLTTDAGGNRELIISNEYGFILDSITSDEIYSKINYLMDNKEQLMSVSQNTYSRVKKNFTWVQVAERAIEIAEQMQACKN